MRTNRLLLLLIMLTMLGAQQLSFANDAGVFIPPAPSINAKAYLLIDADSGKVLVAHNQDLHLPPASLTKVMSLYIIAKALKSGTINWHDPVRISNKAWRTGGSKMFVKVNDTVSVQDLVSGIIIASGNDATIAMAEYLGSNEDSFTHMMNEQARALGMHNTNYTDSTGLPNPSHYTTANDLAQLTRSYLRNFPEYTALFAEKWFTYNNIKQANRNRLLWRYPYANGFKTGHTDDAGFCLIATATKDQMHLIAVVMGAPSDELRSEGAMQLLSYGFRFYHTIQLLPANKPVIAAKVWYGASNTVQLAPAQDFYVTLVNGMNNQDLQLKMQLPPQLTAPIVQNQAYGSIIVTTKNNEELANISLHALTDVPAGSALHNFFDMIYYYCHKIFAHNS